MKLRYNIVQEAIKQQEKINRLSDKLYAMHKDDANNSVKQRANIRTRLSQAATQLDIFHEQIVIVDEWIADLKSYRGVSNERD